MTSEMYIEWGVELRRKRLEAGLTQQALADAAGSTKATVSNIERGLTSVGDGLRIRLAAALGTTVADLFSYPDRIAS